MAESNLTNISPEETAPEAPASPTPPSSTRPEAKPISMGDLQREMSRKMTPKISPQEKTEEKREPERKVEPKTQENRQEKAEESKKDDRPDRRADGDKKPDFLAKIREKTLNPKVEKTEEPAAKVEKKEVVSKDDAAGSAKTENAPVSEEVPAEQLQVLPHDKPDTARRIKQLIKQAEDAKKERDEAKKAAAAAPTTENKDEYTKLKAEHDKANEELLRYRRRYELDNDTEIKSKFDEPVARAEQSIGETLKKYLNENSLAAINKAGGFAAFMRSGATFKVPEKDEHGNTVQVERTAAEIGRGWLNLIPIEDAEFIKQSIGKQRALQDEKKVAVERAISESKQHFEARQQEEAKRQQTAQEEAKKTSEAYQNFAKETVEKTDWLKDQPIPDGATDEQKAKITRRNESAAQLRTQLNTHPKSNADYYQLKLEAAESHHLRMELGDRDEELKALRAQVERLKGASRTTPKAGSLLTAKDKTEDDKPKTTGDPTKDLKIGLRAAMDRKRGSVEDE